MSKRTIIIAVIAVVLFIGALLSLLVEKNQVKAELDDLLNGKVPEESVEPEVTDKETAIPGNGTDKD